jgi:hypothetical protein
MSVGFVGFVGCVLAAACSCPGGALALTSSPWGQMEVRDAEGFTPVAFKRDYMRTNTPVIIRRDPRAQILLHALTLPKLLDLCGDQPALTGNRVVKIMREGFSPEMYRSVSDRLNYTEGLSMAHVISELAGESPGATKTLRDYFEGPYFTTSIETVQDPRFPGARKDWSHPADYLWPPSVRSWNVGNCRNLVDFVADVMKQAGVRADAGLKQAIAGIPFVRALISGKRQQQYDYPGHHMHLFASADKGRGSPPHIHGFPSHPVLLVLRGTKRIVTWPSDQRSKLYPLWGDRSGQDENAERNDLFMVNAFDVNMTRQPDLADVEGGLQGEAHAGDLIYIPCGLVHSLESVGSSLMLAWLRTEETACPGAEYI